MVIRGGGHREVRRHQIRRSDEFLARSFCADEFAKHGPNSTVAQMNFACSHARGTLRGRAWQMPPLRRSRTGAMYARCHLCCGRGHPAGIRYLQQSKSYVAHGFQTLARRHRLAAADHVISEKDASWPLIAEVSCLSRSDECPPPQHLACQGIALWECLIRTFRVDRSPFVDQQADADCRQDSACVANGTSAY
jgi:hypothetical protein